MMISEKELEEIADHSDERNICPVCGEFTYFCFYGEKADSVWDRFDKVSPDRFWCPSCDFRYSEHVFHPEREAVEKYKLRLK